MKRKYFKFNNLDNLTKGIILFFNFFSNYFYVITKYVLSFIYILKDSVIVKRISFVNLLSFWFLLIISILPFFTLLSGELLLFSFPIVIFFVYFLNIFLSKVEFDFNDEIELVEFFEQSLELSVLGSVKLIYILHYIMFVYSFLRIFIWIYFDKLLSSVNSQTSYLFICKIFLYNRYERCIKNILI